MRILRESDSFISVVNNSLCARNSGKLRVMFEKVGNEVMPVSWEIGKKRIDAYPRRTRDALPPMVERKLPEEVLT